MTDTGIGIAPDDLNRSLNLSGGPMPAPKTSGSTPPAL
jgi:hypothetical protein